MTRRRRVVISLHGIRTRGVWQKDLVPVLASAGFIPYVLDYGHFGALKLLLPGSLDAKVEWLAKEYSRIKTETGCERPSIVAHSFGTLQVARLLMKYDHVNFDTVILAAAIIPTDFAWPDLLDDKRVSWVENYYAGKDRWPRMARHFVPGGGSAGSHAFATHHRALYQVFNEWYGHSNYFQAGNFRDRWIPTLLLDKRFIVDELASALYHLAGRLSLAVDELRAFVWVQARGTRDLAVLHGLCLGEVDAAEKRAVISLDDTIGRLAGPSFAFAQRRMSLQRRPAIEALIARAGNRTRVHPDLQWTVAIPLPDGAGGDLSGVLVFDGLSMPASGIGIEAFTERAILDVVLSIGRRLDEGRPDLEDLAP